jgi:hypothetical protein
MTTGKTRSECVQDDMRSRVIEQLEYSTQYLYYAVQPVLRLIPRATAFARGLFICTHLPLPAFYPSQTSIIAPLTILDLDSLPRIFAYTVNNNSKIIVVQYSTLAKHHHQAFNHRAHS